MLETKNTVTYREILPKPNQKEIGYVCYDFQALGSSMVLERYIEVCMSKRWAHTLLCVLIAHVSLYTRL